LWHPLAHSFIRLVKSINIMKLMIYYNIASIN
jgi:hypothetical protein